METYDISLAPLFRQRLAQRQAELRAVVHASGEASEDADEVVDFKDIATEQASTTLDEAKSDQAARELEQVLGALRRLDDQSYGRCVDCGEAIDLRRLAAVPAAPFCTSCQATLENKRTLATRR